MCKGGRNSARGVDTLCRRVLSIIEAFPDATLNHFIDVMSLFKQSKPSFLLVSGGRPNCTSITTLFVFNRYTEVNKTLDDNMYSVRYKPHT